MKKLDKVAFIHGLFGENIDYGFGKHVDIISAYNLTLTDIIDYKVIYAYSFGGRAFLNLWDSSRESFLNHKINLLSVHLGGLDEKGLKKRRSLEDRMLSQFTRKKINRFWNSLTIFDHDKKIKVDKKKIKFYRKVFRENRLSQQKDYIHDLSEQKHFRFMIGSFDTKYVELYKKYNLKNTMMFPCSHRGVIDYQKELYDD